jgi:hypothetical protein
MTSLVIIRWIVRRVIRIIRTRRGRYRIINRRNSTTTVATRTNRSTATAVTTRIISRGRNVCDWGRHINWSNAHSHSYNRLLYRHLNRILCSKSRAA